MYLFNTRFEKFLWQAQGSGLVITCVGDAVVLPQAYHARFIPIAVSDLAKKMEAEPNGVVQKQLDDGTRGQAVSRALPGTQYSLTSRCS